MKTVWLIRITIGLSCGVAGWLVFEIVRSGISGASVGLLAYASLVVVTCWASLRTTSVEAGDQRRPVEEAPKTAEGSTPEEIILNAIRTKGRAKRRDLLPLVTISKSTLAAWARREAGLPLSNGRGGQGGILKAAGGAGERWPGSALPANATGATGFLYERQREPCRGKR